MAENNVKTYVPIYYGTPEEAYSHGYDSPEGRAFRASFHASVRCARAIQELWANEYENLMLDREPAERLAEEQGPDRVKLIIAGSIFVNHAISTDESLKWARDIRLSDSAAITRVTSVQLLPGAVHVFIEVAEKVAERQAQMLAAMAEEEEKTKAAEAIVFEKIQKDLDEDAEKAMEEFDEVLGVGEEKENYAATPEAAPVPEETEETAETGIPEDAASEASEETETETPEEAVSETSEVAATEAPEETTDKTDTAEGTEEIFVPEDEQTERDDFLAEWEKSMENDPAFSETVEGEADMPAETLPSDEFMNQIMDEAETAFVGKSPETSSVDVEDTAETEDSSEEPAEGVTEEYVDPEFAEELAEMAKGDEGFIDYENTESSKGNDTSAEPSDETNDFRAVLGDDVVDEIVTDGIVAPEPATELKGDVLTVTIPRDGAIDWYSKNNLLIVMPRGTEHEGCLFTVKNEDSVNNGDGTVTITVRGDEDGNVRTMRLGEETFVPVEKLKESFDAAKGDDDAYIPVVHSVKVPAEAVSEGKTEESLILRLPDNSKYTGRVTTIPKALEIASFDDGERIFRVPDYVSFGVKQGDKFVRIPSEEFASVMASGEYAKAPEVVTVNVARDAIVTKGDRQCYLRMPYGDYTGYAYYIPREMIGNLDSDSPTIQIKLPKERQVSMSNLMSDRRVLTAMQYKNLVDGKPSENYQKKESGVSSEGFEPADTATKNAQNSRGIPD